MVRYLALLILFSVSVVNSKHLPSFIKPCKKSDPEFKKCVKDNAIDALPYILKGDSMSRIPNYLPFEVPLVATTATQGLDLQLHDLKLYGMNTTKIEEVDFDLDKQHIYVKVFIPDSTSESNYTVEGKLFSFVINDKGPAKTRIENLTVEYTIDYQLVTKRDGKRYIDIDSLKNKLDMHIGKGYYYFGNLFGGNKALTDNFNQVLNDNSKDVDDISKDGMRSLIASMVSGLFSAIFKIPYDEIFID
ncbi:protein takeout-like [Diorhabda carinulata]|uniref:protein takeout-like n=1 Tax=Diorhabda carinulata TaxID=1163345 RepID=UPI0025A29CB3|nr:protein takeout-like [Diorhabda carinulata]